MKSSILLIASRKLRWQKMLPVDMKCGDSIQFTIQQQLKTYGKSGENKQFGCYLDEKIKKSVDCMMKLLI